MTDPETIMHGLRDRDDEGREALKRIAERCELAEARVRELDELLDLAAQVLQVRDPEIRDDPSWERDRADFMVRYYALRAALAGGKE